MAFKVYLAGPIAGKSFDESNDWREKIAQSDFARKVEFFSPLRGKHKLLSHLPVINDTSPVDHPLTRSKGILARDFNDVATCDLLLANFLGAERVSVGTVSEIAWAWILRKPIIVVMEPGSIHDHIFVTEQAGFVVPTLNQAIEVMDAILFPS